MSEYTLTMGNGTNDNKMIYAHTDGGWDRASDAITEAVDHPPHYNKGDIETIDYIVDVLDTEGALKYCHGKVLKFP